MFLKILKHALGRTHLFSFLSRLFSYKLILFWESAFIFAIPLCYLSLLLLLLLILCNRKVFFFFNEIKFVLLNLPRL